MLSSTKGPTTTPYTPHTSTTVVLEVALGLDPKDRALQQDEVSDITELDSTILSDLHYSFTRKLTRAENEANHAEGDLDTLIVAENARDTEKVRLESTKAYAMWRVNRAYHIKASEEQGLLLDVERLEDENPIVDRELAFWMREVQRCQLEAKDWQRGKVQREAKMVGARKRLQDAKARVASLRLAVRKLKGEVERRRRTG